MINQADNRGNSRALVLGCGRSGVAAAQLLCDAGWEVTIVDEGAGTCSAPEHVELMANSATLPDGEFDLCVVSPGIDSLSLWVADAMRRCREVVSELELGWRHATCPVLAVTGTNGKSTLVKLLVALLQAGGLRCEPSGNYGTPMCETVRHSDKLDWIVAEVSSFQLEWVRDFRPKIGIMLNLQPDHLERHGTMAVYRKLKARLFAAMDTGDSAFVHDCEYRAMRELCGNRACEWVPFGLSETCPVRYDPTMHAVCATTPDGSGMVKVSLEHSIFDNRVTGPAAAVAVAVALRCGVNFDKTESVFHSFEPLDHRMQTVGVIDDIVYINDSKATNLSAMKAALEMTHAPVRLIAGGLLKEKDLVFVKEVLKKQVASVYLIGQAESVLADAWSDSVFCVQCGELENAVKAARCDAARGDIVLLSPGCASFDQFRSYADRGNQFCDIVSQVKNK
jgi:UDP-N-acetylmuramoylalanine--D-glutamate ligase